MRTNTLFAKKQVKQYRNKLFIAFGLTFINSISSGALSCPSSGQQSLADMFNNTGNSGSQCNANISTLTLPQSITTHQPINILSGNKFRKEQDIKPQDINKSIGLEYIRYYNSQSNYSNVLGHGWRSSYDIQLLDTTSNIQIIQNDGSQLFFYPTHKKLGNGLNQTIYTASNSNFGTITKSNINGYPNWQWQQPNGQTFEFTTDSRYLRPNNTLGKLNRIIGNRYQPNSDYLALRYDNQQRVIQVQDSRGRQLNISYTTTQYKLPLIKVQSPQGTYQYYLDKQGNLSQYVNANGDRTAYYYQDPNDTHNLTKKVFYPVADPQHPQLLGQWQYDNHDRVIYESLADGKQAIKLQYDATAPLTKAASLNENGSKVYTNILTNALGQTTTYHYKILHGNYRTIDVSGAGCQSCGNTTEPTQLDDKGNLIQQKIGDTSYFYSYDEQSRLTRIELKTKDGTKQWLQSRQYQGDIVAPSLITQPSVVAGKQLTTKINYNQYQQPTQIIQQGYVPATPNAPEHLVERQINYRYGLINGASKLISIDGVLPGNADTINYQYNTNGQLIKINYPEGLTQQFSYDSAGRVSHFKDLDGLTTDYLYDTQGQIIQTTKAGKVSKLAYDAQGRLQQLVDPLGQTLNYQYNHAGELSQVSDGKLAQINLTRDSDGNLTQADLLVNGKVEQQVKPSKQPSKYLQSENDNPEPPLISKAIKDKNGRDTIAYYDDFGRIVGEKSPTTGWTAYQWDNNDNLTQVVNGLGQTIKTSYDSYGRKILVQAAKEKISFIWNNKNQLQTINSNHYSIQYQYDDKNNLIATDWRLDGEDFSVHREYNENGDVIKKVFPSGIQVNYLYDATGNLIKVSREKLLFNSTLASNLNDVNPYDNKREFKLGNNLTQDNIYRKDGTIDFAGNKEVAYSQSHAYKDGYVIDYSYAGKPTQVKEGYSNNNQPDIKVISQFPTTEDSYNVIGQLVKDNRHQYSYDEFGRLTQIYNLNHRLIAQYDYLITGERYKKTVFNNGKVSQITYYIYEDNLLTGEYASNSKDKVKEYVYYGIQPVAMMENDQSYYLTTDHRNAVIAVTDDDKNIVWQGDIQANGFISSLKENIDMNLRGSNQYYDTESGLHYNINRYFSPSRNQYLTPDPVGLAVGDDLYAFAFNRPHEFVDLDGLAPEVDEDATTFGRYVHRMAFDVQIQARNPLLNIQSITKYPDVAQVPSWGGQNSRIYFYKATWPTGLGGSMPDAYFVDKANLEKEKNGKEFVGKVWELKPISYLWDQTKHNKATAQIARYLKDPLKGKWSAGGCDLADSLAPVNLLYGGKEYEIRFVNDFVNADVLKRRPDAKITSGLIYYTQRELKTQKQTQTATEAATSLSNDSSITKLKNETQRFVGALPQLSTMEKLGIIALLIIAVIALIMIGTGLSVGAIVSSVLTGLTWVAEQISLGAMGVYAALATIFGSTMSSANAKVNGEKAQKGTLDKIYDKFKSWFK